MMTGPPQWESWATAHDSQAQVFREYAQYFANFQAHIVSHPDTPLSETRRMMEHWGDHCREPGSVDYTEVDAGGVPAIWARPKGCDEDRVIISLHGGAYQCGSMYSHRRLYAHIAKAAGCGALVINYRLAPEHTWPAPLEDTVTVYEWLLREGFEAGHIAFAGDSAGGALSVSGPLRVRDRGLPMAGASMPISPWGDLEAIGPTYLKNDKDIVNSADLVRAMGQVVVGDGGNPRDPYVAPVYATDLSGLPPMYITVGGYENFIDDARVIAENARNSGLDVTLEIGAEMQHSYQMLAGHAPEADEAIERMAAWVRPRLGL